MANPIENQQLPTIHGILGELERLVSIKFDLMTSHPYYVDYAAVSGIIHQKIEIMKAVTPANSEIKILDDLDRLLSLRSKLREGACLEASRRGTEILFRDGDVLDDPIMNNLNALTAYQTTGSFEKGLTAIERLVKMSPHWTNVSHDEKAHDLLENRLESLSLHIEKKVRVSFEISLRKHSS